MEKMFKLKLKIFSMHIIWANFKNFAEKMNDTHGDKEVINRE